MIYVAFTHNGPHEGASAPFYAGADLEAALKLSQKTGASFGLTIQKWADGKLLETLKP